MKICERRESQRERKGRQSEEKKGRMSAEKTKAAQIRCVKEKTKNKGLAKQRGEREERERREKGEDGR